MKQVSQLALAVQLPDDETFASFYAGANDIAIEQLKSFIDADANTINKPNSFYLFGISGVGKSHLLHAACSYAAAQNKSSLCLSFTELKQLSIEVLDGLEQIDVICLDDMQLIAKDANWQQAVFDLYNRVTEQNKKLIITGNSSVNDLVLSLADLRSRLSWGLVEQVKPLSDDEKSVALQFRATQRGLLLTDEVAKYLLSRLSRDMNTLISALDKLDKASIREQRKITIPFIKQVLFD